MDKLVVDGIELGPSTDYASLLRRQLKHGSIWNEVGDSGPEEGLWRVFDCATGTEVAAPLFGALLSLLTDSDIAVRSGAVGLVLDYAEQIDPAALLALLKKHPSMYVGVKPSGTRKGSPDLAWTLRQAIAGHTAHNADAIQYLRDVSRDPENGFRLLGGLALDDSEWVIENAAEVVAGQTQRTRPILANLPSASKRERFIRALAKEPDAFRNELAGLIDSKVKDLTEREKLKGILRKSNAD
jgi:hypothetical protein